MAAESRRVPTSGSQNTCGAGTGRSGYQDSAATGLQSQDSAATGSLRTANAGTLSNAAKPEAAGAANQEAQEAPQELDAEGHNYSHVSTMSVPCQLCDPQPPSSPLRATMLALAWLATCASAHEALTLWVVHWQVCGLVHMCRLRNDQGPVANPGARIPAPLYM